MNDLFSFRDGELYCHHSLTVSPDPEEFPVHAHETPEVFYFISGRGSFLVEGTNYPLSHGDILLMRPAETHKLLIEPDEPYERMAIHFPIGLFDSLDYSRRLLRPFYNHPLGQKNHYPAAIYPSLGRTFDDFTLSPGMERLDTVSRLLRLLCSLAVIWEASEAYIESAESLPVRMVAYVNLHLYDELSLSTVSDAFNMSASQISRSFRQATGTSLWEYVMLKRLLSARARIARGDTAQEAAFACGFSDYSAFFRAYKKRFGHAPSADRSEIR